MKIKSISVRNFRCFGDTPVTVDLSGDITATVGANGSGKTALLIALTRMFGTSQSQRTITRSDFHLPPGVSVNDQSATELAIEIILTFPELAEGEEDSTAIPPTFNHMIVSSPSGEPVCRVRLEASWTDDGTIEGSVEQNLYWILTQEDPIPEDKKQRVLPHDRGLIQVHYIPANRDPAPELRYAARNRAGRLVRAISWAQTTRDTVQDASNTIRETLSGEQGVDAINKLLQQRWDELKDDHVATRTNLRFAGAGFEEIIRDFGVVFRPDDGGREDDLDVLSDGQQSLFYLALVAAIFDVERHLVGLMPAAVGASGSSDETTEQEGVSEHDPETPGFNIDQLRIPVLTVFELEEPENHLAPHYLARIITMLRSLTKTGGAQVLFSSHSPAVLGRVFPEEIRHFRLDMPTRTSVISEVTLPESTEQSSKYVREAVVAYPELYFAKFVILAEGPSEEVVLPKIADAMGLEIDKSFVCVVPLGGRHVNHFWRLLSDLKIPYATLLDLDAGRDAGGWARIKYVCQQLLVVGSDLGELLNFEYDGQNHQLSEADLDTLNRRDVESISDLTPWIRHLEKFNVYFSAPLDFDLTMLRRIPNGYKNIDGQRGPGFPAADTPEWEQYVHNAIAVAVGDHNPGIELYSKFQPDLKELFPWYRYLFLSRSKPATHFVAMAQVESSELLNNAPAPLKRLLKKCEEVITLTPQQHDPTNSP